MEPQGNVHEELIATFDEHPEELGSFLACYVGGEAWEMESGLS